MKKIAIVGFGSHVTKNILPALSRMDEVCVDAIYVRDLEKYKEKSLVNKVALKHIDEVIEDDVGWVYISTPISTHYMLSKRYLLAGKNVICEKPLTSNNDDCVELMALAKEKNLQIREVCMYQFHKQFAHLKKLVTEKQSSIKILKANFSIPHLPKDDIRYKRHLGGGGLLDVGYYPISLILTLFGKPERIMPLLYREDGCNVDLNGVAVFEYNSFYCIAEWGIGLPYANEVKVITESEEMTYERIFSKPETLETDVKVKKGFDYEKVEIGFDDQFVNMFSAFFGNEITTDNVMLVNGVLTELYA